MENSTMEMKMTLKSVAHKNSNPELKRPFWDANLRHHY